MDTKEEVAAAATHVANAVPAAPTCAHSDLVAGEDGEGKLCWACLDCFAPGVVLAETAYARDVEAAVNVPGIGLRSPLGKALEATGDVGAALLELLYCYRERRPWPGQVWRDSVGGTWLYEGPHHGYRLQNQRLVFDPRIGMERP